MGEACWQAIEHLNAFERLESLVDKLLQNGVGRPQLQRATSSV
jgi:hypothetical protein